MREILFRGKCAIESDIYCGKIIGSVELADCVRDSGSEWAERGCWHWVLKDPRPFNTPVPARGMQGLWRYKGEMK
jgi:hypothetical protein